MDVTQYLNWAGPLNAVIVVVVNVVFILALLILIWARDIRGSGVAHH